MNTRVLLLATLGWAAIAGRQAFGQAGSTEPDTFPFQLLKWSEAEQSSWIQSDLDRGMPTDLGDALTMLILNRSSVTLPLIEKKIEQVLASASPQDCFTDKSIDPNKFVAGAASAIAYAGDAQARIPAESFRRAGTA